MSSGSSFLLAFEGFEKDLLEELARQRAVVEDRKERALIVRDVIQKPIWAQVWGRDAQTVKVASITEAAKTLKNLGVKKWACASQVFHRRSELIQEKVSFRPPSPLKFLGELPKDPWGIWALWDQHTMIASPNTQEIFPLGEVAFAENPDPPSRAYLKLWEIFTVHGVRPAAGSRVIDLGSSPGGWTWVLSQMGFQVVSVDKAPLDPKVLKNPKVEFLKKDAFRLKPEEAGRIDWVFSDLICYPAKLWELVQMWQASGVENFVCTIKFQGKTDFEALEKFAAVPGSRLIHLGANKHEVTWVKTPLSP